MKLLRHSGWLLFLVCAALGCTRPAFPAKSTLARLPLVFEPNQGQAPADVRFLLHGGALEGEFQTDGVRLMLSSGGKAPWQVRMQLVGVRRDATTVGGGALVGRTNYLLGNDPAHWVRGVPNRLR